MDTILHGQSQDPPLELVNLTKAVRRGVWPCGYRASSLAPSSVKGFQQKLGRRHLYLKKK
jgi:hypothetical protein